MNTPLISVIIPIYNVEKYLNKCVDSVINQTYSNLEIILVDDGSPDNCGTMCDDWAKKDNRIKVIHQHNKGLPGARNSGIDIAKGEYITFVDSDDYIHPQMIETLLSNLIKTDSDISVCGFLAVKEGELPKEPLNISDDVITLGKKDISKIPLLSPYINSHGVWAKIYKSSLFKTIKFNEKLKKIEDLNFSYRAYITINRICFVPVPMYYYLQRDGSIMRGTEYPIDFTVLSYNDVIEYYNNSKIDETLKKEFLRFIIKERTNTTLDAYYIDYVRNVRKEEKKKIRQLFKSQKKEIDDLNLWSLKFRLFDISPLLFVFAMKVYLKLQNPENNQLK